MPRYRIYVDGCECTQMEAETYQDALEKVLSYNGISIHEMEPDEEVID